MHFLPGPQSSSAGAMLWGIHWRLTFLPVPRADHYPLGAGELSCRSLFPHAVLQLASAVNTVCAWISGPGLCVHSLSRAVLQLSRSEDWGLCGPLSPEDDGSEKH